MPEMWFRVSWPNAAETEHYSPSLIVRDYFVPGESYALADFLNRARTAMKIASDRVKEKYGFSCSRAAATLASLEQHAVPFKAEGGSVKILEFSP